MNNKHTNIINGKKVNDAAKTGGFCYRENFLFKNNKISRPDRHPGKVSRMRGT